MVAAVGAVACSVVFEADNVEAAVGLVEALADVVVKEARGAAKVSVAEEAGKAAPAAVMEG